ncbi:response regulator [Desulfovibrio sulfodismutans]|uniref:Sensory/regulatory protein RpfC n=1 Tax=Desulfolutivibrio sulfodismutans TaxID=63561 RepID=A0A7K3NKY9_9BACT|nr:ATP-binding protein [Desulfolutivibrio sulfodismutans]NDY56435.1 response regulator [Desulfolutivibrio sulfodismutans]QLA13805.1 response regulator [Desulfolutivibrio sulfodismutans DSM 3696]
MNKKLPSRKGERADGHPLRLLLTVPMVLLTILAAGIVGGFALFDSKLAVGDVAAKLRAEVLARVDVQLREYLSIPPAVNAANAMALSLGLLDPDDPGQRQRYFYGAVASRPSIAYSFFGAPDGAFCGARRLPDGELQIVRAGPETGGDSHNFTVSASGQAGELKNVYPAFDPRTRPWYKAGEAARGPVWTPVYRHFALKDMAITAALPAYDAAGRLVGVFGVDYVLGQIRDFLRTIRVGEHGGVFLLERSGDLVAASAMPPEAGLFTRQGDAYVRIPAAACGLPMVEAAAGAMAGHGDGLAGIHREILLEFSLEGERYFLQAAPFRDGLGLDWIMAAVVPESDFMARVDSQAARTVGMLFLVVGLAAGAGLFIAGRLSAPVENLSHAAAALASGQWDHPVESEGHAWELRQLALSFSGMRRQLRESFAELEARSATIAEQNRTLEDRVARRTRELGRLNNRLRAIFDAIPGHIHVIGRDYRVVDVGDKMLRAMGKTRQEVVGRLCHEVFRDLPAVCDACPVVGPDAAMRIHTRPSTPEEEARLGMAFMVYSAPVLDDAGEVWGFIECLMDISQLRAVERELVRAKEQAEEAARVKGAFLAGMSHEIRTPLNSIIGLTEITLQTSLDPEQRDHLQTVREAGTALLALVNDILDFSRLDSQGLELHNEHFSLPRVISSVARTLRVQARAKGVGLRARMKKGCPMASRGDPDRLRQILFNLVGNAVKFTERGEVEFWAEPWPGGDVAHKDAAGADAPVWVKFFVRDTGIGVSPEKMEVIFDPFRQADGSITRKYGGTGLGLAICRQLVERMGGEIGVESTPGAGSTFFFTLPLWPGDPARVPKKRAPATSMAALRAASRPLRVLLAEDNLMNIKLAKALLGRLGHATHTAQNGREALDMLSRESFDVVLMDLEMPGMDGLAAARAIRQGQAGQAAMTIPVVAMTAHAVDGMEGKCRAAGMNGFVPKPVDFGKLARVLGEVAPAAPGRGDLPIPPGLPDSPVQPSPPQTPPAAQADDAVNVPEALEKLGDDAELYLELAQLYLDELAPRRDQLARLGAEGTAEEVFRLAHSCKNSCGAIGAWGCLTLSTRTEKAARSGDLEQARAALAELDAEMLRVEAVVRRIVADPGAFGLLRTSGKPVGADASASSRIP